MKRRVYLVTIWLFLMFFGTGFGLASDTALPVVVVPSNITVEAATANGAIVTYTEPSATDDVDGKIPIGKFTLTVPNNAMSYSGELILSTEAAPVKFSGGRISSLDGGAVASGTLFLENRRNGGRHFLI